MKTVNYVCLTFWHLICMVISIADPHLTSFFVFSSEYASCTPMAKVLKKKENFDKIIFTDALTYILVTT